MMCTHLHHDHVGWNTQQKDGKWVPTFPNARYVFNKPDIDYFSKIDADPKEGPAELGTFRECVVPILEYGKADVIAGTHRINDFIEIDTAPGHSPGHVFFKLESKGQRAAFIGDVWHHLLQVYYPDWNFPKNSDAAQAKVSRRKVLDYCASSGALVLPGHVGAPFAGRIEKAAAATGRTSRLERRARQPALVAKRVADGAQAGLFDAFFRRGAGRVRPALAVAAVGQVAGAIVHRHRPANADRIRRDDDRTAITQFVGGCGGLGCDRARRRRAGPIDAEGDNRDDGRRDGNHHVAPRQIAEQPAGR